MKEIRLHGEKIVYGKGSLKCLSELVHKRAFIITSGSSMFKNGSISHIENYLKEADASYTIFRGVQKNPDTNVVMEILKKMEEFKPDTVIAVGGGSPIDAAKVASLFYEFKEINFNNVLSISLPEKREKLKIIAVPSTSGTGSEVTKAAVITFKDRNIKVGIKTAAFIPDIAVLDPDITISMPKNIAAETGMDAMTHLMESYINKNIDYYTECIAEGAIINLLHALPSSCLYCDAESRDRVHVYQSIAGSVLANVGLGMSHGISHAFGGRYDLGHGLLNGICLPYVLLWNEKDPEVKERINKLSRLAGEDIISAIINLKLKIGIPKGFFEILDEETFKKDLPLLVENSLKGSTQVNPVKISKEDMELILTSIYYGKEF
ncbi:MAG: iron-containing alcohol dehydrogenase [Bacillota bacterium]|nr:iron-containing alcohol dehydrogenase [Bacillota bacterium]